MVVREYPAHREDAPARRLYVDRTVRTWLGLARSATAETPRLPERLERRFLRLEEYERPERDYWGCWDHSFSENYRDGHLMDPEVDRWLVEQRAALRGRAKLEPLWPSGRRFAVCLTHDVDVVSARSTPRQLLRYSAGGLDRAGVGHDLLRLARPAVRAARTIRGGVVRSPSTHRTIDVSSELEKRYGASASYFFTVPAAAGGSRYDCTYAPRDRCTFRGAHTTIGDMMRRLAAEGFDIGLHGSYYSAVRPGVLAAEREALESATGLTVTTTRQHFLHWHVTKTPQLQDAAGFLADSTLGFNRAVGFRASTTLPFRTFDVAADRPLTLLQVPLVVEDSALLGPIAVDRSLERAREVVRELVDTTKDVGGAFTLLFHPDKLARPEWLALFEWSLAYASEAGGWMTSLAQLEQWWTVREQKLHDS